MALASDALTTLAKLKTRLGISDSSRDEQLEMAISAASAMIVSYLGRVLAYSAAVVDRVAGQGTPELSVSRAPVWSITSIVDDGQTVDSGAYTCVGDDARAGIIRATSGWVWRPGLVGESISRDPVPGHEALDIVVIYAAGYTTPNQATVSGIDVLPADIEAACLMLATNLYAADGTDVAVASESLMSYSVSYGNPENLYGSSGMPKRVEAMLASHRFFTQA
jgi:hypothetical protein